MTRLIPHLAITQEDFERRGLPPKQTKLAARRSYGGIDCTAKSILFYGWSNAEKSALRHAQSARMPGFTGIAVITLALGIGANIFSVVKAVLLERLACLALIQSQ